MKNVENLTIYTQRNKEYLHVSNISLHFDKNDNILVNKEGKAIDASQE